VPDLGFYTEINKPLEKKFDPVEELLTRQVNDYWSQVAAGNIWGYRRRSQFSLGPPIDRRDIPVSTSGSVPGIRQPSTIAETPALSRSTTRVNQTPHQSILPGTTPAILPIQTQTGGPRMALDLGSIIRDLGGQLISARYPQPREIMVTDQNPLGGGGGYVIPRGGVGTDIIPRSTMPVLWGAAPGVVGKIAQIIGSFGLGLAAEDIADMAKDISKVKCKRRRRRLATHSDIKDLAALSAILGKGKLLETWVATRRI
jgi:hypothetical protein